MAGVTTHSKGPKPPKNSPFAKFYTARYLPHALQCTHNTSRYQDCHPPPPPQNPTGPRAVNISISYAQKTKKCHLLRVVALKREIGRFRLGPDPRHCPGSVEESEHINKAKTEPFQWAWWECCSVSAVPWLSGTWWTSQIWKRTIVNQKNNLQNK